MKAADSCIQRMMTIDSASPGKGLRRATVNIGLDLTAWPFCPQQEGKQCGRGTFFILLVNTTSQITKRGRPIQLDSCVDQSRLSLIILKSLSNSSSVKRRFTVGRLGESGKALRPYPGNCLADWLKADSSISHVST